MSRMPSSYLAVLSVAFFLVAALTSPAYAQTETGTIYGSVSDPTGAVVPSATVRLIDVDRGIKTEVATGNGGFYSFGNIRPGHYRMEVEKPGFKLLQLIRITLNVQDNLEQNFNLALGAVSEAVTVTANAENLNTADATVSTLIDNRFVENMPLNGRSFSSLLDLTPGVVLIPSNFQEQGQFSVNGQRPDANYFTVDGVAANLGTSGSNLGQGGAGLLPVTSAFGGMSNLVSLDALQEFRVQTSTFSPEFGRMPGAQVSVVTKSGTNAFHGTAFEYFRNDVLDANDWFADNLDLKKAALRQNDFGGVLGGPILKDKLFFLGSYEGLRVRQPRVANSSVPTAATILSAPAVVQPLLEAFPKPNGAPCPNCQPGTAGFSATYSDPSSLDSYSGRVDYLLSSRVTIFGRFSDAPSSGDLRSGPTAAQYAYNMVERTDYRTQALTAGSEQTLLARLSNEFRFNFSRSRTHTFLFLDTFGGGVPPPSSILFPLGNSLTNSAFLFYADSHPYGLRYLDGDLGTNVMHQINVTDAVSHIIGTHQLKFGMDYRRIRPEENSVSYELAYEFLSLANVLANKVPITAIVSRTPSTLIFSNWSLFAQDTWKAMPKLTLSYGLRWEYNAAPSSPNGTLPMTVNQVNDLATMTLAPPGTALWHSQKDNFAPRLGIAWQPCSQLVIRAGGRNFLRPGLLPDSQWIERIPLHAAGEHPRRFLPTQQLRRSSSTFFDQPSCPIPSGRRSQPRYTQDLRVERGHRAKPVECRCAYAHLCGRWRPQVDAARPLFQTESELHR
jgi:hypothetical protein